MDAKITFDGLNVNYSLNLGSEIIEIEGTLRPYNTGRCIDYEFEVGTFTDDISEGYWDENWEEISEEIIDLYQSSI
jgi:hypothetical protein